MHEAVDQASHRGALAQGRGWIEHGTHQPADNLLGSLAGAHTLVASTDALDRLRHAQDSQAHHSLPLLIAAHVN